MSAYLHYLLGPVVINDARHTARSRHMAAMTLPHSCAPVKYVVRSLRGMLNLQADQGVALKEQCIVPPAVHVHFFADK